MVVKGTYFQNDAEKPLVYGDVEISNVKRQELKFSLEAKLKSQNEHHGVVPPAKPEDTHKNIKGIEI